jgi:hypothetical protein
MIAIPLLLAASLSGAIDDVDGTADTIFKDGFEIFIPGCPNTISAPGGSRSILEVSDIYYGADHTHYRHDWPVFKWDFIWGHAQYDDPEVAWPGINGSGPLINEFGRYDYVAARFNPGSNHTGYYGYLTYPATGGGPNIDIRISQTCGDFSAAPSNPACSKTGVVSSGDPSIYWRVGSGNVNLYCVLQPNTNYYLNIRFTNPASTTECRASQTECPITLINNFGH